jgi:hypothetical protein
MTKYDKWKLHQVHQWPIQLEYIDKCHMLKYLFEDPEYCPKSWQGITEDEFWSAVKKDVERKENG